MIRKKSEQHCFILATILNQHPDFLFIQEMFPLETFEVRDPREHVIPDEQEGLKLFPLPSLTFRQVSPWLWTPDLPILRAFTLEDLSV